MNCKLPVIIEENIVSKSSSETTNEVSEEIQNIAKQN